MSSDEEKVINILELPNEILRRVIAYVPDQLTVGQVCKTFYDISCSLRGYKLNILHDEFFNYVQGFDEGIDMNENYKSILQSSRRIESLVMSSENNKTMTYFRLRRVIEHIGEHVRELKIKNRSFDIHGISLLNLMPNLDKIELHNVRCNAFEIPQDFKLRLHNLKELRITLADKKFLEVFNTLPDDVLRTVKFDWWRSSGVHFQNQRKIEHVEGSHGMNFIINLRQLKLKSFSTTFLTSINIHHIEWFEQEHVNFISNELTSLEELRLTLTLHPGNIDFSKLQKLKNLKIIRLSGIEGENLKTLKSNSLQCLEIFKHKLLEEVFLSLSINCPNLREFISVNQVSANQLPSNRFAASTFLAHFPRLVKLTCCTERLTVPAGWENHTLEHFHSTSSIYDESIKSVEFIKSCKNLRILSVDAFIANEPLQRLLIELPNLKMLCFGVERRNKGVAEIIKQYGNNIECFHNRGRFSDYKQYVEMERVLKEKLPVSKIVTIRGFQEFYIKKQGKVEKCCDRLELL